MKATEVIMSHFIHEAQYCPYKHGQLLKVDLAAFWIGQNIEE